MPDATPTRASHRTSHARQHGNALLVVLIALTGLGTLAVVTLTSVQSGISVTTSDRSQATALLAAESGAHAGIDFLRDLSYSQYNWFSNNIRVNNINAETPSALRGNDQMPGQSGNIFSADMRAWYRVTIFNNETDPNFDGTNPGLPRDSDGRVFLESVGFGPNRATATVIVELQGLPQPTFSLVPPPPSPGGVLTISPPPQFLDGIAILSWRQIE